MNEMQPFEEFVAKSVQEGKYINTMFEEHLFALVGALERIALPLAFEGVPYEMIGGGAVMVHVNRVDPSAVRNTKDIDIMIHRSDLERVIGHAAKLDMLLPPGETKARNAIHLIFSGEKTSPTQSVVNPPLRPEYLSLHGVAVAVIPVADLVQMKISNNRDIDRVHVRDLDSVGLITEQIERGLPVALRERLQEIRESE